MKCFDIWLWQKKFITEGETAFQEHLAKNTPLLIIAWIMSEWVLWLLNTIISHIITARCDFKNHDGSLKTAADPPKTYSHAMKLQSALTYSFGQNYQHGMAQWSQNLGTQSWEGNPSVSVPVSQYMLLLRKRKARPSCLLP